MGLFIGLEVSQQDLEKIKNFQDKIELKNPVKAEEIHCTLFATTDNFEYVSTTPIPVEIHNITLGKIKTQSGVDCLVLYFDSETLKNQHDFIKDKYNVKPFYAQFIPHLTLSYDCGELDITQTNLKEYIQQLTFIKEYTQDLKFEVNKRKTVRD